MGAKHSGLRNIYNNMKYRCYGPKLDERTAKAYRDKGIRVCEEWLGYYGNFKVWALAHGYKPGLSIDRIDPDGNYCPENCRWVTVEENRARHGGENIAARVGAAERICGALAQVPEEHRDAAAREVNAYMTGFSFGENDALARYMDLLKSLPEAARNALLIFTEGFVSGAESARHRAA